MTTSTPALRRGARIETTGVGRTARWGSKYVGTVLRVRGDRIYVRWDGVGLVDDEMAQAEVRLERPAYLSSCPCANCIHS